MKLTNKDLKLIYELDFNYRASCSHLRKKTRMSEQLINYKVNALFKNSIIKGYSPLIDYSRFGLHAFIVYFKVNYRDEKTFKALIEQLKGDKNITSILECDGHYDLAVTFAFKNPSSFNKRLQKLVSENPQLRGRMILTTVVEHHYPRNYLTGEERTRDFIIGGDREEIEIDDTNKGILAALINGKKKATEIANEVGINPKTVVSRLKWLEAKGVLRMYRILLNKNALGIHSDAMLIRYHNIPPEEEEAIRYFCESNPHVVEFIKTFGEWDAIIYIETKNRADFRDLFLKVKEKFDNVIEEVDNISIFNVHKKQYIPMEILSEN